MTAGSPWFRATPPGPEGEPGPVPPPQPPYEAETAVYGAIPAPGDYGATEPPRAPQEAYQAPYEATAYATPTYEASHEPSAYQAPSYETPPYEAQHQTSPYRTPSYETSYGTSSYEPVADEEPPAPATEPLPDPLPGPGRAERRRAARRKGRGAPEPAPAAAAVADGQPARPLSRVEARRAARAAKESFGVVLSRGVGELFITFGVVMLLFVTYQLWWTNVRAGLETDEAKRQIENSFDQGGEQAGAFEPGKGFAIMYIPKLDVVVPIAEGIGKTEVLDKGMVGHYGEGRLKTAMPADKQGNFAVAGHRNTHGEPFRYINRLQPGDPIVVETRDAYYTYEMTSTLPQTSPSNVTVIEPVPKQSGFKGPGRYITLTTCTPEFTSTYRLIVWGKMVEERPRSKGKPAALTG
ncbi:class E sortase [Streptomyces sp. NPDC101160]|uniref:class E sortase n=1 Tax=Streptomyces sp. NPDC101160 TaxID=3366118 RepID=UPI00382F5EEC